MSLFITSLNSGSNGNCYYIGNNTDAILVDAGISCRETEKRMRLLGLSMNKVKAIFVSHEHSDHIRGLASLSVKYDLPVYITNRTLKHCSVPVKKELANELTAHSPVNIGTLTVTAFPKLHDAVDPHSFIVNHNGITIGVFTDIGSSCDQVVQYFSQCNAAFLEANYDEQMLDKGKYPQYLKNRIRGGQGHLSNSQALNIFNAHRPPFMTHLLLAHLSKDNNDPNLVQQLFEDHADDIQIVVASRYVQSAVYLIHLKSAKEQLAEGTQITLMPSLQLSLF